jgi:hypothetical protein
MPQAVMEMIAGEKPKNSTLFYAIDKKAIAYVTAEIAESLPNGCRVWACML